MGIVTGGYVERTALGRTEITIPRFAIGGWQAAGWAKSDARIFTSIVHRALDLGVNFIDTAESYGKGVSEELIGKALRGKRHDTVIASKFFPRSTDLGAIRVSLESSLRRLSTDYLDLYYYHWPARGLDPGEVIRLLELFRKEGKIRAIGVSNWMEPEWEEFTEYRRIDALQGCYNLLWRSMEPKVLPLCREHSIAVLPYSPLAQGILAGRFTSADEIPPDPRRQNVLLQKERIASAAPLLARLGEIARIYNRTMSQVALRWLLEQPGVTSLVVGVSSALQLEENLGAFGWNFDQAHELELREVSAPLSAGLKPHDTLWNWHPKHS